MPPAPASVTFDDATMRVALTDGRAIAVPLAAFPKLAKATPAQRDQVALGRHGLHWEAIDEDLSVAGLLASFGADDEASRVDDLVLGTTNAPYRRSIGATELANVLSAGDAADWRVHVATFFTEVRPELVLAFARVHGIPLPQLADAYHAMKEATGEANPALEKLIEQLAATA